MDNTVNSNSYWEKRFNTDWESYSGRAQTAFFANLALKNFPKWFVDYVNDCSLSIGDVGCAEGDSVYIFDNFFKNSTVVGIDFSSIAIQKAKQYYPEQEFYCSSLFEVVDTFDVVFSSNTLEHFNDPMACVKSMLQYTKKFLVLLLPFQEYDRIKEHFTTFDFHSFPVLYNGFYLSHYTVIDSGKIDNTMWSGKQILLIYANIKTVDLSKVSLDSLSNNIRAYYDIEAPIEIKLETAATFDEIKNQIATLESSLITSTEKITRLENEMKVREQEFNNKVKDIHATHQNHLKLVTDNALALKSQLDMLSNELQAIHNSDLWKIGLKYYRLRDSTWFKYVYKSLHIIKRYGAKELCRKIYKKLFQTGLSSNIITDYDASVLEHYAPKDRTVFIFAGVPFYDIGGGQRSSQLSKTFSRMGYSVVYVHAFQSFESDVQSVPIIASKHQCLNDLRIDDIRAMAEPNSIFIFEIPHQDFIPYLNLACEIESKIIYEHIDNWDTSLGNLFYSEEVLTEFLLKSDIVVATSAPLKDVLLESIEKNSRLKGCSDKVIYLANAVDTDLFDPYTTHNKPDDLRMGTKIILYYGSLWGEWFDWETLKSVALALPEYSFNMIGDYKPIERIINELPNNIHFLGLKPQNTLPGYLQYSDIAILPFKNDDIGKYVSPLKIFEYISMRKPVVATPLPDIKGYSNVYVAYSSDDWIQLLRSDLKVQECDRFISEHNWYARCNLLLNNVLSSNGQIEHVNQSISVIILNRNNMNVIFRCIDSLLKYNTRYSFQIIVVDNKSTDGSYEMLQQTYSDKITLLRNKVNGCSSGRNLGLQYATGEIIVFLDSDQWVVSERWLDWHLEILNRDLNIGAVGWAAGWFDRGQIAGVITDYLPNRGLEHSFLYRTDIGYLGTGGMSISKKLIDQIGGFDENFDPTCYEDTDLSMKIKDAGYELAYCPYLGIKHLPHQTTQSGSVFHSELMIRNGTYFKEKWQRRNPRLLECYYTN